MVAGSGAIVFDEGPPDATQSLWQSEHWIFKPGWAIPIRQELHINPGDPGAVVVCPTSMRYPSGVAHVAPQFGRVNFGLSDEFCAARRPEARFFFTITLGRADTLLGLAQGAALHLLYYAANAKVWPAPEGQCSRRWY
jgi:hypothetical protein